MEYKSLFPFCNYDEWPNPRMHIYGHEQKSTTYTKQTLFLFVPFCTVMIKIQHIRNQSLNHIEWEDVINPHYQYNKNK